MSAVIDRRYRKKAPAETSSHGRFEFLNLVATALCAVHRPQDGRYNYGLVVVVVVVSSFL
jgi:hypothetical protein